uniref:Uncharacterized protein n=1 Tax=Grammatophora oceanica TaxID=210454 RepID=A0A7S1YB71_9STRA|mmetsp:Transcript_39784/g.59033  ORF Transcript_39784/g.59033 Transcript_39784/m.59033 type:complete len:105 (+) Transcript_39784:116-430(+)
MWQPQVVIQEPLRPLPLGMIPMQQQKPIPNGRSYTLVWRAYYSIGGEEKQLRPSHPVQLMPRPSIIFKRHRSSAGGPTTHPTFGPCGSEVCFSATTTADKAGSF